MPHATNDSRHCGSCRRWDLTGTATRRHGKRDSSDGEAGRVAQPRGIKQRARTGVWPSQQGPLGGVRTSSSTRHRRRPASRARSVIVCGREKTGRRSWATPAQEGRGPLSTPTPPPCHPLQVQTPPPAVTDTVRLRTLTPRKSGKVSKERIEMIGFCFRRRQS